MSEIWKKVDFIEDCYVSNLGRVKLKGNITKGCVNNRGYPQKRFLVNGRPKSIKVHRLVMMAFVGESDMEVDHINGVKTDNRLSNLQYLTRKQHAEKGARQGVFANPFGEDQGNAKLTNANVIRICELLNNGACKKEIAKKYGVSWMTIYEISTRRAWKRITEGRLKNSAALKKALE